jgi:hypothetical protein
MNGYTSAMMLEQILSAIDVEIARLKQARALLSVEPAKKATNSTIRKKRGMSTEGRKRIAEAQRKRWAAQKKDAK